MPKKFEPIFEVLILEKNENERNKMTTYIEEGEKFFPVADGDLLLSKSLKAGVYTLVNVPFRGFAFERSPLFDMPPKLYGDVEKRAERVLTTFESRENTTGVLLHGDKGAGKSLLAKVICSRAVAKGWPVILVNHDYHGDAFNKVIRGINQPAVVFFDEFEKVYREKASQEGLLTLLDGVAASKKMYLFTSNSYTDISDFLRERPGRAFYSFEYRGLEEAFIKEYLEDKLNNKEQIQNFMDSLHGFYQLSFDRLQAIVEEMNRFKETFDEAVKFLNVGKFSMTRTDYWVVEVFDPFGAKIKTDDTTLHLNVLALDQEGEYWFCSSRDIPLTDEQSERLLQSKHGGKKSPAYELDVEHDFHIKFKGKDIKGINLKKGLVLIEAEKDGQLFKLRLKDPSKMRQLTTNWSDLSKQYRNYDLLA